MFRVISLVSACCILSGCDFDPRNFETPPVTLASKQGPVVCQLYTKGIVRWDRAIERPDEMSLDEADALCQAEGLREKAAP